MPRIALRLVAMLLVSLAAVVALPTTGHAQTSQGYYFQFMDRSTGEFLPPGAWPFSGSTEIILASNNLDVRQSLPITFQVIVNGDTVFTATASSPTQDCRGATGCSVHGYQASTPPPGSKVQVIAKDGQGNVLASYGWASSESTTPPPTTQEKVPTTQTDEVCWWCVGLKLFFVLVLICVLINYIITTDWWSWWMLWIVLIFAWIPTWLGWFWFFGPNWWWLPQLLWIPLLGGFAWWGMRKTWWAPWMRFGFLGWSAVIAFGVFSWWAWHSSVAPLLLWIPWFYVWNHHLIRPNWWKPWMWGGVGIFGLWWLAWLTWLPAWWAWIIPVVVGAAFFAWWLWSSSWTWTWWWPGFGFFIPWILWPWIAFMNSEWDIWWCAVVFIAFTAYLVYTWWVWIWKSVWWNWWGWWWVLTFVWLPLFCAWNLFAWPTWWWLPNLFWFPLIAGVGYYYARHQPWWKPWMWYCLGGWALILALGFINTTTNYQYYSITTHVAAHWWFQLPFVWLPWAGFFMYAYFMRQTWWRTNFWWLFGAFAAWLFIWFFWLSPFWWWMIALWAFPFFGWWLWWTNNTWWRQKLCWGIPWIGLPILGFASWMCADSLCSFLCSSTLP